MAFLPGAARDPGGYCRSGIPSRLPVLWSGKMRSLLGKKRWRWWRRAAAATRCDRVRICTAIIISAIFAIAACIVLSDLTLVMRSSDMTLHHQQKISGGHDHDDGGDRNIRTGGDYDNNSNSNSNNSNNVTKMTPPAARDVVVDKCAPQARQHPAWLYAAPCADIPNLGVGPHDEPLPQELKEYLLSSGGRNRQLRYESIVPKNTSLRGLAFLFLVRDSLPLATIWDTFFDDEVAAKIKFSIHLHAATLENAARFTPQSSRYVDAILPYRVDGKWGTFEIARAEKLLFATALARDAQASHFILLSESCIPLYALPTFALSIKYSSSHLGWDQSVVPLSSGAFSRVASAESEPKWHSEHNYNFFRRMILDAAGENDHNSLRPEDIRKAPQWKILHAKHVRAMVEDRTVYSWFHRWCWTANDRSNRACCCDEHYVPTLFAHLGIENETALYDCATEVKWYWPGGNFHGMRPKTNYFQHVDNTTLSHYRYDRESCSSDLQKNFDNPRRFSNLMEVPSSPIVLPATCPLIGRKFKSSPFTGIALSEEYGRLNPRTDAQPLDWADVLESFLHTHNHTRLTYPPLIDWNASRARA